MKVTSTPARPISIGQHSLNYKEVALDEAQNIVYIAFSSEERRLVLYDIVGGCGLGGVYDHISPLRWTLKAWGGGGATLKGLRENT